MGPGACAQPDPYRATFPISDSAVPDKEVPTNLSDPGKTG
jgi:hypothetical protein